MYALQEEYSAFFFFKGLIDGRVEPEVFTTKLQKELNSSPQPCLVPFLKKSLPYLQHSLATQELSIEGVRAPTLAQVGKLPPAVNPPTPAPVRINSPSVVSALPRIQTTPQQTRPPVTAVRPSLTRPGSILEARTKLFFA